MNHHLLFIHSPIVGYPGFFQVLAIMNKAAAVIHIPADQLSSRLFLLPFPQLRSSVPLHRPSRNRNSRAKKPAEAILWHKAESLITVSRGGWCYKEKNGAPSFPLGTSHLRKTFAKIMKPR